MNDEILIMRNVSKHFSGVHALKNVGLVLKKGEVNALVGKNGAGKSTLIKVLAGIHTMDTGEIIYKGKKVEINSPSDSMQMGINFVYQETNLVPFYTIAENIFLGKEDVKNKVLRNIDRKKLNNDAKELMKRLGININVKEHVNKLPLPIKQIVSIARIFSEKNVELVVFDEPTAPLSYSEIEILFELIGSLKKSGISIVYISHRLDEVFEIADSVTVIRDGLNVGRYDIKEITKSELVEKITGKPITDKEEILSTVEKHPYEKKVILRVENFEVDNVVRNASLQIHEGEVLGLVGLVGSGKTELAEAIFGLRQKKGKLTFLGKEEQINSPKKAINKGLYLVPDDRRLKGLLMDLPIKENITISTLASLCSLNFINRKKQQNRTKEIIDLLSIKCSSPEQAVRELSGGNQQKVVFGRGVLCAAKVFIFDEITQGVDVETKETFFQLIKKMAHEEKVGVLYISCEISEILKVADRIAIMKEGRLESEMLRKDVDEHILFQQLVLSEPQNFSYNTEDK